MNLKKAQHNKLDNLQHINHLRPELTLAQRNTIHDVIMAMLQGFKKEEKSYEQCYQDLNLFVTKEYHASHSDPLMQLVEDLINNQEKIKNKLQVLALIQTKINNIKNEFQNVTASIHDINIDTNSRGSIREGLNMDINRIRASALRNIAKSKIEIHGLAILNQGILDDASINKIQEFAQSIDSKLEQKIQTDLSKTPVEAKQYLDLLKSDYVAVEAEWLRM